MKKIVFLLLAMLTAFSLSFAFETRMDDDPEEAIPLQYNEHGEGGDGNNIRGGVFIPIVATYNPSTSCVSIDFIFGMGVIDIKLINQSTGESSLTPVDSSFGNSIIPVLLGCGLFRIEFISGGSTLYYGYFNVL